MRVCNTCNQSKKDSEFYYSHTNRCKSCYLADKKERDYRTPENMIRYVILKNINRICKDFSYDNDFNSHEELITYLKHIQQWNKFTQLFNEYKKSKCARALVPSIFRKDKEIGYVKGNIEVVRNCDHSKQQYTYKSKNTRTISYSKNNKCWTVRVTYKYNKTLFRWNSSFPTSVIAKQYLTKVDDEINKYQRVITEQINISDWDTIFPSHALRRKNQYTTNKIPENITRGKYGFSVYVTNRLNGNKSAYSYLPTKELAIKHYYDSYMRMNKGLEPIVISKKDWKRLGLDYQIQIQPKWDKDTNSVKICYNYTTFRAYVTNQKQYDYVVDLLEKDINANNKITIHNIYKRDWKHIML